MCMHILQPIPFCSGASLQYTEHVGIGHISKPCHTKSSLITPWAPVVFADVLLTAITLAMACWGVVLAC